MVEKDAMLSPYRVLDLASEELALCGRILADLGADVIKVERPGGDPSRNIGPFFEDKPDPERSLFWSAYNCSKRSITLDLESDQGRAVFRKLVAKSDIVIESFPPGHLDKWNLGYTALKKINPAIIMTSITPFGQHGPYKDYKGSDLVCMAMGGYLSLCGDPDRPPVRISIPQIYLNGATEAAAGTTIALYHRQSIGEGQHVDVPIWLTLVVAMMQALPWYDLHRFILRRLGIYRNRTGPSPGSDDTSTLMRQTWCCKDGWVNFSMLYGPYHALANRSLVEWMSEEGMASDLLLGLNWDEFDPSLTPQSEVVAIMQSVAKFLLAHTKQELLQGAVERDLLLCPVNTIGDIMADPHLQARDFWVTIEDPKIGGEITYPGAFVNASQTPWKIKRAAPRIGEHNQQVYEELGLSKEEPVILKERGLFKEGEAKGAFDGLKVMDLSWAGVGPLITKYLADLGATVIKVESMSRPDVMRLAEPHKDNISGFNRSGLWNLWNSNRYGISLNLKHDRGIEVAKRIVSWSDVVVETFTPGTMEKLGLGYEDLRRIRPNIIMVRSCVEGHSGPRAKRGLLGTQAAAQAGFTYITGWPDRDPAGPYGAYTDFIAPRFAAAALVAALDYRYRTGKGQCLEISQYEAAIQMLTPAILDYTLNKRETERMGNACVRAAPHGVYRCRGEDRWCAIAVFTEEEWAAFCGALGRPQWTTDSRFATLQTRKTNEDLLDRLVEEWTAQFPAEEVMQRLQAVGVPAGVVQNASDLLNDPHMREQGMFWPLEHCEIGQFNYLGQVSRLSRTPAQPRMPAPCLGQDTEHVMTQMLGMTTEEFVELFSDGAFD